MIVSFITGRYQLI